jgi:hypothetical protein
MSSGDDDQKKQLSELLEFLFDPKLEVRKIALQHLKSYTGKPETRALLDPNQAVTNLSKLLSDREVSFNTSRD